MYSYEAYASYEASSRLDTRGGVKDGIIYYSILSRTRYGRRPLTTTKKGTIRKNP